jgi:hypothetical protein
MSSFVARPVRERSVADIISLLEQSISSTGWEEAGLLSLSFSDYSDLAGLLPAVSSFESRWKTAVSRPSLRPDSFLALDEEHASVAGRLTFAPEAGSDTLRRRLNKSLTGEQVIEAAEKARRMGATGLKLYFMVGLPMESDDDLHGIIDLASSVAQSISPNESRRGRKRSNRRKLTVSISPFIPRPHTPLELAPQLPLEELQRRVGLVRKGCSRFAKVVWNDPRQSVVEAVLGLGDGRTADLVRRAREMGARFDAWRDLFRWDIWEELLTGSEDLLNRIGRERDADECPWDFVDCGVERAYLRSEYEAYRSASGTSDCRVSGSCSGCGACDGSVARTPGSGSAVDILSAERAKASNRVRQPSSIRLRVRYGKRGLGRFSSHLDMVRLWTRTVRRAGLGPAYTSGYVPRPRLRFGPPLPLGMASEGEYVDIELVSPPPEKGLVALLNEHLPKHYFVVDAVRVAGDAPPPDRVAWSALYEIGMLDEESIWGIVSALSRVEGVLDVSIRGPGILEIRSRIGSRGLRPDMLLSGMMELEPVDLLSGIRRREIYSKRGESLLHLSGEGKEGA